MFFARCSGLLTGRSPRVAISSILACTSSGQSQDLPPSMSLPRTTGVTTGGITLSGSFKGTGRSDWPSARAGPAFPPPSARWRLGVFCATCCCRAMLAATWSIPCMTGASSITSYGLSGLYMVSAKSLVYMARETPPTPWPSEPWSMAPQEPVSRFCRASAPKMSSNSPAALVPSPAPPAWAKSSCALLAHPSAVSTCPPWTCNPSARVRYAIAWPEMFSMLSKKSFALEASASPASTSPARIMA
mmetsp:Transcript_31849/g.87670  ORF Transcript_31849/g.87670 Transcript_31849/m.87670 type:complete len:245 (+) Transcript_31849:245-979(+)